MDINSMSGSLFNQYSTIMDGHNSSKLDSALGVNQKDATDEEMMDACKQFEQYFVEQMFKEMKKTVPEDSLLGNNEYYNMFEDNMIEGIAEKITESEQLGFAQRLYESMSAQRGTIPPAHLEQNQVETEEEKLTKVVSQTGLAGANEDE